LTEGASAENLIEEFEINIGEKGKRKRERNDKEHEE
jgi:hypothetical protein